MNELHIISVVLSRRLSFASHQNAVPLVRDLAIHNHSDEDWDDITLELTANPDLIASRRWHVDRVLADSTVHLTDLDVSLQSQLLMDLTEAIRGELIFTLQRGSEALETRREPVEWLARHEWGGIEHMPELLAAFSLPNEPVIERVLKSASAILRQADKSGAIDGYASGQPQRVWETASAIWSAVCGLELDYALPPASFEYSGQKIRLPSMILEAQRATCLDVTLLFTAALEQAGFNPVVVITQGHAFAGVWLQPEEFKAVTVDAASILRKRIALDELIVFETTLVTQRPWVRFSEAIETRLDSSMKRLKPIFSWRSICAGRGCSASCLCRSPVNPALLRRRSIYPPRSSLSMGRHLWMTILRKLRPLLMSTGLSSRPPTAMPPLRRVLIAGSANFWTSRCATAS